MSKTVIRITPVGGFDIPGLENWFAVMAGLFHDHWPPHHF